jgi:hypothetical protein
MKKLTLILVLMFSGTAAADEMTTGELHKFCNANDAVAKAACRFYILGAVQGIEFGDGAVLDKGHLVARSKTIFCIPPDMPQSQMVDIFRGHVQLVTRLFPQDMKLPALSTVGVAMMTAFPCPKSN